MKKDTLNKPNKALYPVLAVYSIVLSLAAMWSAYASEHANAAVICVVLGFVMAAIANTKPASLTRIAFGFCAVAASVAFIKVAYISFFA